MPLPRAGAVPNDRLGMWTSVKPSNQVSLVTQTSIHSQWKRESGPFLLLTVLLHQHSARSDEHHPVVLQTFAHCWDRSQMRTEDECQDTLVQHACSMAGRASVTHKSSSTCVIAAVLGTLDRAKWVKWFILFRCCCCCCCCCC